MPLKMASSVEKIDFQHEPLIFREHKPHFQIPHARFHTPKKIHRKQSKNVEIRGLF